MKKNRWYHALAISKCIADHTLERICYDYEHWARRNEIRKNDHMVSFKEKCSEVSAEIDQMFSSAFEDIPDNTKNASTDFDGKVREIIGGLRAEFLTLAR